MGKIRTRHNQGVAVLEHLAQGLSQPCAQVEIGRPDQDGNNFRLGEEDLDEGHLHFNRVFGGVNPLVGHAVPVFPEQLAVDFLIDLRNSQGGPKTASRIKTNLAETGRCVIRPQEDHDIDLLVSGLIVPVSGDLTGVDVARMGQDQGDGVLRLRRDGALHVFLYAQP